MSELTGTRLTVGALVTTRLQMARRDRGWSQGRLILELERQARVHGIPLPTRSSIKSLVSRWENGHSQPDVTYRRLLREVIGLTDEELGFAAVVTQPVTSTDEELLARLASSRTVDAQLVQLLQAQTDQMRLLDRRLGAPALLEQMRAHITTVEALLSHAVLTFERAPLAAVLADAAALAGWQALDIGAQVQAWHHYETAKRAAREAGSATLLAHAMGEQAFALVDLHQPERAVALIREAQTVSRRLPALLRSWLFAAEAEACAAASDPTACRRALDDAANTLPAQADPELPYLSLDDAHLARWRGHSLAQIGDAEAVADLSSAAKSIDDSFTRARAGLHCDLAIAHLVRHENDSAREQAGRAQRLASQVGSLRQRRRIQAVRLAA